MDGWIPMLTPTSTLGFSPPMSFHNVRLPLDSRCHMAVSTAALAWLWPLMKSTASRYRLRHQVAAEHRWGDEARMTAFMVAMHS